MEYGRGGVGRGEWEGGSVKNENERKIMRRRKKCEERKGARKKPPTELPT